jgi:hypothetical protein
MLRPAGARYTLSEFLLTALLIGCCIMSGLNQRASSDRDQHPATRVLRTSVQRSASESRDQESSGRVWYGVAWNGVAWLVWVASHHSTAQQTQGLHGETPWRPSLWRLPLHRLQASRRAPSRSSSGMAATGGASRCRTPGGLFADVRYPRGGLRQPTRRSNMSAAAGMADMDQ